MKPYLHFYPITIFPDVITAYTAESIIGRAIERKLISVKPCNLRDFALGKHRQVDDKPYGGGPGMVLMIEPLHAALTAVRQTIPTAEHAQTLVIATDARGEQWSQQLATAWLQLTVDAPAADQSHTYSKKETAPVFTVEPQYTHIIMLCGRYHGMDERIYTFVDKMISVGPYILTGGELPAMIMIDTLTRLLPGVLGDSTSPLYETEYNDLALPKTKPGYPVYTRPADFSYIENGEDKHLLVPAYLREGNHATIKEHRRPSNS